MKIGFFDCFSGVSGDMVVGAMIGAGLDVDYLRNELGKLGLSEFEIAAEKVMRGPVSAVKFDVKVSGGHKHHRGIAEIESIIRGSSLDDAVKELSCRIFAGLAEAEAEVHGIPAEEVGFHEVGAVDSIVDIVSAAVGANFLGIAEAYVSPIRVGKGSVKAAHGMLPIPAPATVLLLRGFDVVHGGAEGEFTTPTGAAIVSALCKPLPVPCMRYLSVGYGAGSRTDTELPNVFRLVIGETAAADESDRVCVLETNIDDMSAEIMGHLSEELIEAGALDVFTTPVQMKKGRPGILLTVIAPEDRTAELESLIFRETTTFGIRRCIAERSKLRRRTERVDTKFGPVRIKVGTRQGEVCTASPEYEDCRAAAVKHDVPLKVVFDAVLAAFRKDRGEG